MSRVLVVGGSGRLGRYVSAAVKDAGHELHRASRNIEESAASHRLDLGDVGLTERVLRNVRPDIVVQMTGGTASDAVRLAEINVVPTVNLIRAAARVENPPSLFITGSAAEYGDPGASPAGEASPIRPLSAYGWIKAVETATAIEMARRHDLEATVIRPFNPVFSELPISSALGNFRQQMLGGHGPKRSVVCGRVDVIRDFVGGSFIGEAVAQLIARPPGGIVNICSGVGIRLADVMYAVAEELDVELELKPDPELEGIPAPAVIVGDPNLLYALIAARSHPTPESLATELLGQPGT